MTRFSKELVELAATGADSYSRGKTSKPLAPLYCTGKAFDEWMEVIGIAGGGQSFYDRATGQLDPADATFNFRMGMLLGTMAKEGVNMLPGTAAYTPLVDGKRPPPLKIRNLDF